MNYLKVTALVGLLALGGCGKKQAPKGDFDYDYKAYTAVLTEFVKGEAVDYKALKENRANLDAFVQQLADMTLEEYDYMDADEQMALWINAYNALTLRSVIDAYPVESVNDIEGIWDGKRWEIAGKTVTLDDIEHNIIRPEYEDPRIHFALCCAAKGCPSLFNEPFMPGSLDEQLDSAVSMFVNNVDRNAINPHRNTVTTAEFFRTYADDFTEEYSTDDYANLDQRESAVLNFIFSHADSSIFDFMDLEADWSLEYVEFDWSLNDVEPEEPAEEI